MHPKGTCSASLHCVGIAPYETATEKPCVGADGSAPPVNDNPSVSAERWRRTRRERRGRACGRGDISAFLTSAWRGLNALNGVSLEENQRRRFVKHRVTAGLHACFA